MDLLDSEFSDSETESALVQDLCQNQQQRRARQFQERRFEEDVDEKTYRQQNRVPKEVIDFLEEKLFQHLVHPTKRNQPLSVREQLMTFCQFVGTNAFYHLLRDARGPSAHTIFRVVHRVADAIITLKPDVLCWPQDCSKLPLKFYEIGGFPQVVGCIDGTHVKVSPPKEDEESTLNRHHEHSLNVLAVSGPDFQIFYANANFPGRCHDSRVLRESSLWQTFEVNGVRPFPDAVILGDAGYPLRDWLITPFPAGPADAAKTRFNTAHCRTRNIVERTFGIIKKRFYSLSTGLRVRKLSEASKIVIACFILHNLCIKFGDQGDDFEDFNDEDSDGNEDQAFPVPEQREGRRTELLHFFQEM